MVRDCVLDPLRLSVSFEADLWVLPEGVIVRDRVYCPDPILDGLATVRGDEARHLARVRRAAIGTRIELFDGRGFASEAEVMNLGKERVELRIVGPPLPDRRPAIDLVLATAVPKGERFDWLVEKATELGVAAIQPILAERSVVEPGASKLERLRRVVVEASKQCGRNRLLELRAPVAWPRLLEDQRARPSLLANPGGPPLPEIMTAGRDEPLLLAIGPEGGFTDREVECALDSGFRVFGLGPTILRVETAAISASAVVLAHPIARG